jgi:hypothetical protein
VRQPQGDERFDTHFGPSQRLGTTPPALALLRPGQLAELLIAIEFEE